MNKIIGYKLIRCIAVNEELKEGWELWGYPFYASDEEHGRWQAIVLRENTQKSKIVEKEGIGSFSAFQGHELIDMEAPNWSKRMS